MWPSATSGERLCLILFLCLSLDQCGNLGENLYITVQRITKQICQSSYFSLHPHQLPLNVDPQIQTTISQNSWRKKMTFFFFFCIPLYYRHRVLSHMLFGWLYKLEWNLRINKILGIQYEFQSKSTQRGQTIVRYPLGPQVDAFKHTHYKATWVDQLLLLSNKIKWGKECTFLVTEILQSPQARYKRDGDMWN